MAHNHPVLSHDWSEDWSGLFEDTLLFVKVEL